MLDSRRLFQCFQGEWNLPLEHAFGDGEFRPRGSIRLLQHKPGAQISAKFIPGPPLDSQTKDELIEAARTGGIYRVRTSTSLTELRKSSEEDYVMSFTDSVREHWCD